MILKDIFEKPVDRPIEGVIKADDEASLRLEIEEYVLTNEVEKRLESFFDAYNNYAGANGVWVSGFFGSGKSHLLKMLALLLENRKIDGEATLPFFLSKCGDNEILRGDLTRAVSIPSKSILFNIDQKTDIISKDQSDALLSVFVKVFDEMCGYYGKQGYIAQFERELDNRGLYVPFKATYETIAGKPWEKGREEALLEGINISKAYAQVSDDDETLAQGILEKYRKQYRVSIEDFSEQVNAYIEQQVPNFRLNFFVDEVGQYIAGSVKLMTNLQTIAESLATKCRGRSWVIVTAQEDMETVMGDEGKQQSNDFSKIQARFANRMKLTSADVAEVIRKRLLTKNEVGINELSVIYSEQSNNFKTLFNFADDSRTYQNFQDKEHFIHSYPFIPYQFELFQSAIQNLSKHSAFEGKHSSVGERSMLGVFQQVAIKIGDYPVGQLATFDLMFEGIRTALKSQIQQAVIQADRDLTAKPFAIQLLKALFLVKYVKEFKPTIRNLCVLMLPSFDKDISDLKKEIEEALRLLEQETYIERNGELYEYLTDEEKDIEQEIKSTDVESTDISRELAEIIFGHIIKDAKIRVGKNGQDYPFSKKLDDHLFGRDYELSIHVISPFHENAASESFGSTQSMGKSELIIMMPHDDRLRQNVLLYKRTEKYIRQNRSSTQSEVVGRILDGKAIHNRERYSELQERVENLISNASFFVNGTKTQSDSTINAKTRILQEFYALVSNVYPNLQMLRGIPYTEKDIAGYFNNMQHSLLGEDIASLPEAEQELLNFIQSENKVGVRTTIKSLLDKFERKPYGWHYAGILCIFVQLYAHGKVEVHIDGNIPEKDELEKALHNSRIHNTIILHPQIEFTASQTRTLKRIYEEFFDTPSHSSEAKILGKDTSTALQKLIQDLTLLKSQAEQFPFLVVLSPVLEKLKEFTDKSYTWYLTEFVKYEDSLLDMKENVIDPIQKFMSGQQKDIFDNARKFVQTHEANFDYVDGDEATHVLASLADLECFKGSRMQQMKIHIDTLQKKITIQTKIEIAKAREHIVLLRNRLCGMSEFSTLSAEQQKQIAQLFDKFIRDLEQQKLIAVIRDSLRRFEENDYQRQLSQIAIWVQPAPSSTTGAEKTAALGETSTSLTTKAELPIEYVSNHSVHVLFEKAWLADEADVDNYLQSMRKALLEEIRKGKRIRI